MESETLQSMVLLAGQGERFAVLGEEITVKGRAPDGAWVLFEVKKDPENKAPPHSHPWAETYYMLSGGMRMRVGDEVVEAQPGMSILVPPNVVHQFLGPVLPQTRFLALASPGSAEGFFRDMAALPPGGFDPARIAAIAGAHGVAIARPS